MLATFKNPNGTLRKQNKSGKTTYVLDGNRIRTYKKREFEITDVREETFSSEAQALRIFNSKKR